MLVKSSCVFVVVLVAAAAAAAAAAAGAVAPVLVAIVKLCRSLPNVLSGSRLCPTRFPLFSFLLCLLVCLCSYCRCCCLTCRQCNCFSSLVDVLFVCVCGIGAHLDCVTRITAPLPCKVSLFHLSVDLLNCHCPIVWSLLLYCFVSLGSSVQRLKALWSRHCTRTLLYVHCAHGTMTLFLTHFGDPNIRKPPFPLFVDTILPLTASRQAAHRSNSLVVWADVEMSPVMIRSNGCVEVASRLSHIYF